MRIILFDLNKDLKVAGNREVFLEKNTVVPYSFLKYYWEKSTRFGVVNSNLPVVMNKDTSSKNIAKIKKAISSLNTIINKDTVEAYWVQEWPGTESNKADRLLIFCDSQKTKFEDFFKSPNNVFKQIFDGWEDLMLFNGEKLMFYVCNHEFFGEIFGMEQDFSSFNLPSSSVNLEVKRVLKGKKVSNDLIKLFFE